MVESAVWGPRTCHVDGLNQVVIEGRDLERGRISLNLTLYPTTALCCGALCVVGQLRLTVRL